jgi:hypothetical protein
MDLRGLKSNPTKKKKKDSLGKYRLILIYDVNYAVIWHTERIPFTDICHYHSGKMALTKYMLKLLLKPSLGM